MALSEKNRHAMYEYFVPESGEETTSEMLSYFPARDVEEPVTKQFLKGEFTLSRLELHDEIAGLRGEMRDEIAGLRTEMRGEIAGLRTDMASEFRSQLRWIVGIQVAVLAIVVTLVTAFV